MPVSGPGGAQSYPGWRILEGDCRVRLAELEASSVQTCVTSPPYFGLRDYGHDGQIGLEPTPDEFVAALVGVFREVRRVLRDDGTVWLNLGDSYASGNRGYRTGDAKAHGARAMTIRPRDPDGIKPKDLLGVPWMVAFALRADGWYLRSDIIWNKPNPMPESVQDRPTKAHEYVFLLSKGPHYYYDDGTAIKEAHTSEPGDPRASLIRNADSSLQLSGRGGVYGEGGRNKRSVWTVTTQPYPGAHFATFPPKLIEPCILAGSPKGGVVLDPFAGAGTTGVVCGWHGRSFVGIELNPVYTQMARDRIAREGVPWRRPADVPAVIDGQLALEMTG